MSLILRPERAFACVRVGFFCDIFATINAELGNWLEIFTKCTSTSHHWTCFTSLPSLCTYRALLHIESSHNKFFSKPILFLLTA